METSTLTPPLPTGFVLDEPNTPPPAGFVADDPAVQKNAEGLLRRFGKQFSNVGLATPAHELAKSEDPVQLKVADLLNKMESEKGQKLNDKLYNEQLADWTRQLRLPPEQRESDFLKAEPQYKPLPENPFLQKVNPATGLAEKVVDVGAGLAGFVAQLAVTKRYLPAGTPDSVIWEVQNLASGGPPGKGAAMQALYSIPGKALEGLNPGKLKTAAQLTSESALLGGVTAVEGGSPTDIALAAAIPSALRIAGSVAKIPSLVEKIQKGESLSRSDLQKIGITEPTSQTDREAIAEKVKQFSSPSSEVPVGDVAAGTPIESPKAGAVTDVGTEAAAPEITEKPPSIAQVETTPTNLPPEQTSQATEAVAKPVEAVEAKSMGLQTPEPTVTPKNRGIIEKPEELRVTSLKNAVVDEKLAKMGLPPLMKHTRESNPETFDKAMKILEDNPRAADNLLTELSQKPRTISKEEDALLLHKEMEMETERYDLETKMNEAVKNKDEQAIIDNRRELNRFDNEFKTLTDTTKKVGTLGAQSLQFRKVMLRENYTLARMEQRMSAAKERTLTEPERTEIKKEHDEFIKLQKEYDDYKAKTEANIKAPELDNAIKRLAVPRIKSANPSDPTFGSRNRIFTKEIRDSAIKNLTEMRSRLSAGFDPAVLVEMTKLGGYYFEGGVREIGAWSKAIVDKTGDWAKPYLDETWKALQKQDRDTIKAKIAKSAKEKGGLSGLTTNIQDLAKTFISQGIKDREPLIDILHETLKDVYPGITRRDVMEAITNYGRYKLLGKEEVDVEYRKVRGETRQVLKLQDIYKGKAPPLSGFEYPKPGTEERLLIKQVNEAMKEYGIETTDPETQAKAKLDTIKTRLKNQIEELEKQIADGQKAVKTKTNIPYDKEALDLKAKRDVIKEQYDKVFNDALTKLKERLSKREKELDVKLATLKAGGEIPKKERKEVALDSAALKLKAAIELKKRHIDDLVYEARMNKLPMIEKVITSALNTGGILKSLQAGGEVSGIGRQLLPTAFVNKKVYFNAVKDTLKAYKNPAYAKELELFTETHPKYQTAVKYGRLQFTKVGRPATEEFLPSTLPEKIPVLGNLYKRGDAAFAAPQNKARIQLWDVMTDKYVKDGTLSKDYEIKPTPDDIAKMHKLGGWLNDISMRSSLGQSMSATKAGTFLNLVGYAPRFLLGKLKLVTSLGGVVRSVLPRMEKVTIDGKDVWKLKGNFDKTLLKESSASLVKFVAVQTSIATLAYLTNPDDNKNIFNPLSSDFFKVRVGNSRYDTTFGIGAIVRLFAQMTMGERLSASGRYVKENRKEIFLRFIQSKEAPILNLMMTLYSGRDFVGQPVGRLQAVGNAMTMMFLNDAYDAYKNDGLASGIAALFASGVGVGVQSYPPSPTAETQTLKDKLAQKQYKQNWDDLTQVQQKNIRKGETSIAESELKAKKARSGMPYIESEEQRSSGLEIKDKLSKNVQSALTEYAISTEIKRTIGDKFYLNEERYTNYKKLSTANIEKKVSALLKSNWWKNTPNAEHRADRLSKEVTAAKAEARIGLEKNKGLKTTSSSTLW